MQRWFRVFQGDVLSVPGRTIAVAFFVVLFAFPLITNEPYILRILMFACIYAIYAASWDTLAGYTGQINLGHAVFFGSAAYTVGLLSNVGFPVWATIPIGALVATGMGLIIGIPALRIRGIYLALASLAYPIVLLGIVYAFPEFTGGEYGITGIAPLAGSKVASYYIVLCVMLISVIIMWKITDVKTKIVRTGVLIQAIREDEIAARASGINTVRYKLLMFSVSGFFAGIAGALYAHVMRVAGPSTLDLMTSVTPMIWTIFGGIGTIYGPVAGVFILFPALELFRVFDRYRMLLFGVLIIVILLFMPEGIAVWFRDKIEVNCPRCKLVNRSTRRTCRACGAQLHLEKK